MKVLCISGSRADYGSIEATYKALKKRGSEVELAQFNNEIKFQDPDLVILEGDRFEILRIATEFFLKKKIIAHLGGGDLTEGSQDDSMRHAITKLSHLHFVTCEESAQRVIQLGEEPWRVHVVGEPAVDNLQTHEKEIATKLVGAEDFILVVWHPNTLVSNDQALSEAAILLTALRQIPIKKLILSPNVDACGFQIANLFEKWCAETGNRYIATLPRDMYLTCLKYCKCLVGNSSSGFYEAPSFGTPVVNIGDRQEGRLIPPSMTVASIDIDDIIEGINIAITMGNELGREELAVNVYAKGNAADKIAEVIDSIKNTNQLLQKRFVEIKGMKWNQNS